MYEVDEIAVACFEIGSLPDTSGVAVALFSIEGEVSARIIYADDEILSLTGFGKGGEFKGDGGVSAAIGTYEVSVEPYGSFPIGGSDNEEGASVLPGSGDGNTSVIPGDICFVGYAGEGGSPGEGDGNFFRKGVFPVHPLLNLADVGGVEFEIPVSVEVDPVISFKIGAWMFWQGDRLSESGAAVQDDT